MNPRIDRLHPYPFERLAALKDGVMPNAGSPHIALSIGEPKHAPPAFVVEHLADAAGIAKGLGSYPLTRGSDALRARIAGWAERRFQLPADALGIDSVLPVNGTREALFAFAQAMIDGNHTPAPTVVLPNPFYQIYEGAALLAGAEPVYADCPADNGFLADHAGIDAAIWDRCALLYVCSPGNPTGAVMTLDAWREVLELADRHDFVIVADECYSELYGDETQPPLGLLEACQRLGRIGFERCMVFHSLSKRSSLPGLRSGFVAGDRSLIARFLRYRTYHGCAMPTSVQDASALAWSDEEHVRANRDAYRAKFDAVLPILEPVLDVMRPEAGFYLWPQTPIDDETFARELFRSENVTVLPGRYLSRPSPSGDPGANRVRMALVATLQECVEAAERIHRFLRSL